MLRYFVGAIIIGCAIAGPVQGQQSASLSPGIPMTGFVYEPCKTVSENPEIADADNGICVTAAAGFVASLRGVDSAVADQAIADAVVAIAPLAVGDADCNLFDDEIAAAVRLLSTRSTSPDQVAQLQEIAATIDECTTGQTATITETGLGDTLRASDN